MRISAWSSDVCSSDRSLDARSAAALRWRGRRFRRAAHGGRRRSPGDRLAEHRNIAKCVEGFPCDALRIFDPVLVGARVAARGARFVDGGALGVPGLNAQRGHFRSAVDLKAEMLAAGLAVALPERELTARDTQHP